MLFKYWKFYSIYKSIKYCQLAFVTTPVPCSAVHSDCHGTSQTIGPISDVCYYCYYYPQTNIIRASCSLKKNFENTSQPKNKKKLECGPMPSVFPIVDTCLSCEDTARQTCAMMRRWRFLRHFCVLHFQRVTCNTCQTCILNSHSGHTMCRSMVDIQSVTAEIRRGKKEEERKIRTTGQKYNVRICYAGRP